MTQEALRMALEAMESVTVECNNFHHPKRDQNHHWAKCPPVVRWDKALTAIKKALTQPEQETVGYWKEHAQGMQRDYDLLLADYEKLAQRTWLGLTDVEIEQAIELISMLHGDYATEVAYAIEAKLKEKNT